MLDDARLKNYIIQNIDLNLADDESSLRQSYDIKIAHNPEGFLFIPTLPLGLTMNDDLYYHIFDIVTFAVYPVFTLIRADVMRIVAVKGARLEQRRAFFYPWKRGVPKRLVGTVNEIVSDHDLDEGIPLMDGLTAGWNFYHAIVSGPTGSGKSSAMRYIADVITHVNSKVIVIDPKISDLARWARQHDDVELLIPSREDRPADFLNTVLAKLSALVQLIYERQHLLYEQTKRISTNACEINLPHIFIMIDELASLTLSGKRTQINDLMNCLSLIAYLGRESKVSLIVSTQNTRVSSGSSGSGLPAGVRDQFGLRILLGPIDLSKTQFLFPGLKYSIPIPMFGDGTGLVEIDDGKHYGIEPIAMPTILDKGGRK